jgi:hypothetical protein
MNLPSFPAKALTMTASQENAIDEHHPAAWQTVAFSVAQAVEPSTDLCLKGIQGLGLTTICLSLLSRSSLLISCIFLLHLVCICTLLNRPSAVFLQGWGSMREFWTGLQ